MAETAGEIADDLRERALKDGLVRLECAGCTYEAWTTDVDQIVKLVEHSIFEHGHRQGIIGIRWVEFVDAYTLAMRRGSVPLTEHEQQWRDEKLAAVTS